LLRDHPSGFGQGDRRGHARVGNLQDRSGWQAIDIPAHEHVGVPPQKGHKHLIESNLLRQPHHGDFARRIAGLDLDFLALNFAGLGWVDFSPDFMD
jgi:hypothetical protein